MKLPTIWGQGQLFAFSALDGKTDLENGLCGYLSGDRLGICFQIPLPCELYFTVPACRNVVFSAVTGDYIALTADGEALSFLFLDAYTVIGKVSGSCAVRCHTDDPDAPYACALKAENGLFAFAVGRTEAEADTRVRRGLQADYARCEAEKEAYYEQFSYTGTHPQLAAKCLSVMKTQVYTPEGSISGLWSTPDRFPHRYLWLWDSCFHAIGFRHLDTALAQKLLLAVFSCQQEDGFIPHMTTPDWHTAITQPPVIAYAALKVFEKSGDLAFLREVFERNGRFLRWCDGNRRKGERHLYVWHRSEDINCRCDESGMDNSTRFDTDSELYAVDLSCYMANEMQTMAKIARLLGETEAEKRYTDAHGQIRRDIDRLLWDEAAGLYFDYDIDRQRPHTVSSVASFLPLLAGVCSEAQARRLAAALTDPAQYGTAFPIPTLPAGSDYFGDDMWRGPVWINMNYMVIEGLERCGYADLADSIRTKTVHYIEKYALQTGVLYEFYDSLDLRAPHLLNRKGPALQPYLPAVKMQCIRDYGWTATLTLDWLKREEAITR